MLISKYEDGLGQSELEPDTGLQEVPVEQKEKRDTSKGEVTNISNVDEFLDKQEEKDCDRDGID
ncbi:hypothetical protein ACFL0K_01715 [Patescibacteria group bacterium]